MSGDGAPTLHIRLLGAFEVKVHGALLPRLASRKSEWLLSLLALRAGQSVERGWLRGVLWPDSAERAAQKNLRNALSELRRALGPEACWLRSPTPHTLCLDLAGVEADAVAFDAAVRRADLASLHCAVSLYGGPLLEGCVEEWAFEERQVRQEAFLRSLETLAHQALEAGESKVAEGYLRRAVTADPLRESAQRSLMQVLAAGGQYAAMLQLYRELRSRLHYELNAEPDAETQALFRQLRSAARGQRGTSARGGARAPGRGASRQERGASGTVRRTEEEVPSEGRDGAPRPTPDPWPAVPTPPFPLARGRLVGRETELSALERQLDAALAGRGATFLLAGEPGIGKTRLAREASSSARGRGFRVLIGRCDEQGAAPYQPLAEAVREYPAW